MAIRVVAGAALTGPLVAVLLAVAILALLPASIAASKDRSFIGYYLFGLAFFLPALVVALVISRQSIHPGDIVKLTIDVRLDGGGHLPSGHTARVLDVDVIDNVAVVSVAGPNGGNHWVARKAVRSV